MLETAHPDQAAGLRRMVRRPGLRVLPVAGGAHSAERSLALAQLAVAVAAGGCSAVVLDQSKGETARALGARPRYELLHVLRGEKTLADVTVHGHGGLRLVSASRGLARAADDGTGGERLFAAFARLEEPAELVMFNVEDPEVAARVLPPGDGEVLLVVSPSRASITGAYAHIKRLSRSRGLARYRILLVDASDPAEGEDLSRRIAETARRFLGVHAQAASIVPRDPRWRSAATENGALVVRDPGAAPSRALQRVAADIAGWHLIEVPAHGAGAQHAS
jgi:flagellar biosynthesis protein FlhG